MMLPPIHKQVGAASGSANESIKRRGTAATEIVEVNQHDRVEAEHTGGRSGAVFAERLLALERENDQIRAEVHHLRQLLSNNHHSRDDDKSTLTKVSDDLQRAVYTFNAKAQADALWQQREQQKAALLFAEVARVGHALESVDHTVRNLSDETRRRFDHYDHQLAQLSSLSTTASAARLSPTKRSQDEYHHHAEEIQRIKHALSQLRTELESDRNERWKVESDRSQWAADLRAAVGKTESTMDARIATHLERVHSKLVMDKMDMVRTLDEYRELITGADFKRMSNHMLEFSRVHDHLQSLERWIHGEHSKIKRVVQSIQSDHEHHVQAVVSECSSMLRLFSSVFQQQDEDSRDQAKMLQEAVAELAGHVQRKVFALEEVVPMEVRARQAHDDKLWSQIDTVVKSLSRAIAAARDDALAAVASTRPSTAVSVSLSPPLPDWTAVVAETVLLQRRLDAFEEAYAQTIHRVHAQLDEVKVDIANRVGQPQLTDSDAPLDPQSAPFPSPSLFPDHAQLLERRLEALEEAHAQAVRRVDAQLEQGKAAVVNRVVHAQRTDEGEASLDPQQPFSGDAAAQDAIVPSCGSARPQVTDVAMETDMVLWGDTQTRHSLELVQPFVNELSGRQNELVTRLETLETDHSDAIAGLQRWSATHAEECRQCYGYLQYTLDQTLTDVAVRQTLDRLVDDVLWTARERGTRQL